MTLIARLQRLHRCAKSSAPMFEQLSKSTLGHRTFRCLACGAVVTLKNQSAL